MKSFFLQNLSLLRRIDSPLATRMEAATWPASDIILAESRDGSATIKAMDGKGNPVQLHADGSPVEKAVEFARQRISGNKSDIILLAGFGLGHVAIATKQNLTSHQWLGCIEAREDVFRAAMESVDLSTLLASDCVSFFVGQDWVEFQTWIRLLLSKTEAISVGHLTYPPSYRLSPAFYCRMAEEVARSVNRRQVEINTLIHLAPEMERNYLRNLPVIANSHGVKDFAGALSGIPFIVVAAGPSLNAAIPYLKMAQGKAAIVCVGKALRLLLAEGIVPEFVCTLDMIASSVKCFEGLEVPPEVALVFDPDCFDGIPAAWKGPRISYDTGIGSDSWSRGFIPAKGILGKGLSVAHTAFFFARLLTEKAILLAGVDLAFSGEHTHAEGTTYTWGGNVNKLNADWISVMGANGKPVRTLSNFQSFITAFETAIADTKFPVVQTSETGAMIRGAEHLPLSVAFEKYLPKEDGADAKIKERIAARVKDSEKYTDNDRMYAAFSSAILEECKVSELAERGRAHSGRVQRLDPRNKLERNEYRKLISKMVAERSSILGMKDHAQLSKRLLSGAAVETKRISRELRNLKDEAAEKRNSLELKMFDTFFSGHEYASGFLKRQLEIMKEEMCPRKES